MRYCGAAALALTAWLLLPTPGRAQIYVPDPEVLGKIRTATQKVTLGAKIGYAKERGGYYVKNNSRFRTGDKIILNQNYEILKKMARLGQPVAIEGRVNPADFFASHIFIERLNGKPYQGRHAPLVKLY